MEFAYCDLFPSHSFLTPLLFDHVKKKTSGTYSELCEESMLTFTGIVFQCLKVWLIGSRMSVIHWVWRGKLALLSSRSNTYTHTYTPFAGIFKLSLQVWCSFYLWLAPFMKLHFLTLCHEVGSVKCSEGDNLTKEMCSCLEGLQGIPLWFK